MSYDFTAAKTALNRADNVEGWADRKSAQLEADYLTPLQLNTLRAEVLAEEIAAFNFDVESKINEIINSGEQEDR